jgi:hypothetical protein
MKKKKKKKNKRLAMLAAAVSLCLLGGDAGAQTISFLFTFGSTELDRAAGVAVRGTSLYVVGATKARCRSDEQRRLRRVRPKQISAATCSGHDSSARRR